MKKWLLVLFVLLIPVAHAVAIGVNKAVIDFPLVLRGGYAETPVFVTTDSAYNISLEYETMGDIASWLKVLPDNVTLFFSVSDPQILRIAVEPPLDAANGNYTGSVRVLTGALGKPGGQYGSSVQAAFIIRVMVEIVGNEIKSCDLSSTSLPNVESGFPLEFFYSINNNGNVRVRPTISINVWDQEQRTLVLSQDIVGDAEILPTTQQSFRKYVPQNLAIGQYWVDVSTPDCRGESLLELNVVERGSITDVGELVRIDAPFVAEQGQIIPITAVFRNKGERTVSAKFEGTINLDEKIISVISTEPVDVPPGETANIDTFAQLTEEGHNIIKGRIRYNNKLTFEGEAFTDVSKSTAQGAFPWTTVIIVVIIIFIFLLLVLIRRRRRHRIVRRH
ncbi:MAG: hypothetical protein V1725_03545 [archaeon]